MNDRKTTARFYGFETTLETMPSFAKLRKPMSLAALQLCAGYVWARERGRKACPVVRLCAGKESNYYYDLRQIALAPTHRNLGGLLHELAHALGVHDKLSHGPAFRKRCLRLYREYGEWDGRVE